MPSVAEIKAELKRLKIKGITGKKKAELLAMLPADSCMRAAAPKRRTAPARARSPSPEPVPVKAPAPRKVAARAVASPAAVALKTVKKEEFVERSIPGKKVKPENPPKLKVKAAAKPKSGARRSKVDSLAKYLRGYSDQAYQDYEDSRGVEVIYPTRDVVDIITRAYNNEPFEQIVAGVGYNEEETATMIYDHFMGRGNKKYVDEDIVMRTMPEREDD